MVTKTSASTEPSTGTKRSRSGEPKFYAVRVGHRPGIYHSWPDCQAQIKGCKGAQFKSFASLTLAESFLNADSSKPTGTKFYGVQNGRVPGVYTDWPSAQAQIVGWTKPKHKSFATRAEAEAFVLRGVSNGQAVGNVHLNSDASINARVMSRNGSNSASEPPNKKRKTGDSPLVAYETPAERQAQIEAEFTPDTDLLLADVEDGFDPRIYLDPQTGEIKYKNEAQKNATKLDDVGMQPGEMLKIYTDGSTLGNGQHGAIAGIGVFFGPGDDRNLSEALSGPRQTNQRAELTALLRALEIAPLSRSVTIYSDSRYAIDCVTVWFKKWRTNGWVTASKKPVENKDIVESITNRIEERNKGEGVRTEFCWLKGHASEEGNIRADELAVRGARIAKGLL